MMAHFEMPQVCWIISSGYVYCWHLFYVWPKTKHKLKADEMASELDDDDDEDDDSLSVCSYMTCLSD